MNKALGIGNSRGEAGGAVRTGGWCHSACQPHGALDRHRFIYPSGPTGITIPHLPPGARRIPRFIQGKRRECQTNDFCPASREESHCVEDGKWYNNACCQEQQARSVNPLHGWQVSPRNTQVTQHQMESRFSHMEKRRSKSYFNSGCLSP